MEIVVGSELNFKWPKTKNIFRPYCKKDLVNAIKENAYYNVSEKLDGSNFAISSEGWFSSRNKIVAHETDDLSKIKFQKLTLDLLEGLPQKLRDLKSKYFDSFFETTKFQIIGYGEFINEGTAMSKYDAYNYKRYDKAYFPGNVYMFGLGLVFENNDADPEFEFDDAMSTHISIDGQKKYYILYLNEFYKKLFDEFCIKSVDVDEARPLRQILTDWYYTTTISGRRSEGLILTQKGPMSKTFKWKYLTEQNKDVETFLHELEEEFGHKDLIVYSLWHIFHAASNFVTCLTDKDRDDINKQMDRLEDRYKSCWDEEWTKLALQTHGKQKLEKNGKDWKATLAKKIKLENKEDLLIDPHVVKQIEEIVYNRFDNIQKPYFENAKVFAD